jgi:drug/metabolite transporter (DMT)-like permease
MLVIAILLTFVVHFSTAFPPTVSFGSSAYSMSLSTLGSVSPLVSPSSAAAAVSSSPAGTFLQSLSTNTQVVGTAWLVSSALFTTYSTTAFLQYKPPLVAVTPTRRKDQMLVHPDDQRSNLFSLSRPTLLTLYRFGGSLLLGLLLHPDFQIRQRLHETLQAVPTFGLSALFLFVANFSNSISLSRIGISLTYTSKCAIPIITALLTVLLDGPTALPNTLALLSLLPIAAGIAAASWNAPTFEKMGFAAALVSAASQSALNVTSKRAMMRSNLTGPSAQRVMVAVGLCITLAVVAIQNYTNQSTKHNDSLVVEEHVKRQIPPVWLSCAAFTAYHAEYVLSFMFVKLVAPITYGTCDAIRRLSVILSGRVFFGGAKLTKLNIAGIALALLGALSYSVTTSL